jgi:hypothetical protein
LHFLGGCGAFGGFHDLKAIIQLMAAAEVGRDVKYFTFGVKGLGASLQELHAILLARNTTVGTLRCHFGVDPFV